MNPVSANDILSYQGNVGLGLNDAGADIGKYGETDLKDSNSQLFNLSYLNQQKNKAVWQQKISERDEAMKLIADEQLKINQALPKDREILLNQIKEIKDIYFKNNGDVKSDSKVWYELNDKLAKFKEGKTLAATRFVMGSQGYAEAAKEQNPYKKRKMMQHWDGELGKGLYEEVMPYQQTMDWDNGKIFRPMTEKTIEKGVSGFNRITETRTDLENSYRDYVNAYQQGDDKELGLNVDTFLNSFYGGDGILTPDAVQEKTQEVNNRLRDIAIKEGYDPNDISKLPQYLKPMNPILLNGKIQSNGYKWDDWYKIMLYDQYKSKENSVYDKNLESEAKTKAAIEKDKAQAKADMIRASAYADAQRANAGKYRMQTKVLEERTTPAQNWDELKTKSQTVKTKYGFVTRVNWDDLQVNTREYLGQDPMTHSNGKVRFVNIAPTQITDKNGVAYNDNQVQDYYQKAIDNGYKGSIVDYLNSVGMKFNIETVGREKGKKEVQRSGRLSSYQNQTNKKTQTSLFLEDDNTPDEIKE